MEWKRYYREEFASARAEAFLRARFDAHAQDPALDELVARGAILSFPHTSLFCGGDAQARAVSSLYRLRIERVIALGVFHAWGLDATRSGYLVATDPDSDPAKRRDAYEALRGAFLPGTGALDTPFGRVELAPHKVRAPLRIDQDGLLAQEYSLDTFLALLRYYSVTRQVRPPELLLVYIGMTRDPVTGSFETARELAGWLAERLTHGTAVVATGDLTHYGISYTEGALLAGRPSDRQTLEPLLRKEVEAALEVVVSDKDYAGGFPILDRRLNNDQRYLLPVVSELLGPGAAPRILDFHLSDYAAINHVAPPCFVASSLVVHVPGPGFARTARGR